MLRRRNGAFAGPTALLLSAALGVLLLLPASVGIAASATAAASPTYQLALSEVTPTNGYSHEVASSGSSLAVSARVNSQLVEPLRYLSIEIASQNVPGQDGTLSDDNSVPGGTSAYQSDTDPSVYRGSFNYLHLLAPGTYYWQGSSPCLFYDANSGIGYTSGLCVTPVYTLTITKPPTAVPTVTPPPPVTPVKVSTRISLSAKTAWSTNGWKVTATLSRNGAPGAGMKLVGQWRTNGSWRKDSAWRTNRYGKLRVLFDGETRPTQYRFIFKGNDSTQPSYSKAFFITRRR